MISNKELRIGNYVYIDNPKHHPNLEGKIMEVASIDQYEPLKGVSEKGDGVTVKEVNTILDFMTYSQFMEFVKPIILNEYWFDKFGFESVNSYYFVFNEKFKIEKCLDGYYYKFRAIVEKHHSISIAQFRYVHQLQNIIFSLTGKELELIRANI